MEKQIKNILDWLVVILVTIAVIFSFTIEYFLLRICFLLSVSYILLGQWHFINSYKIEELKKIIKKHEEYFEFVRNKK